MKVKTFGVLAGVLVLIMCGNLLAQRPAPAPRPFEYFGEYFELPPMPPMPPMPAMPPMPPMPPMPEMPLMPAMPEMPFGFAFAGQAGQSADPETRLQQEVFRSLLRNNADRAIELATERLKTNPADPVVLGNLSAIASSGSAKAQPLLLSIAKTSTSTPARRDATMSIVRNRDDKDALALLEDLYKANADNVEVRRVVVSSIGRMSDPRAVTVLANIVRNDTDESIRRSAIRALGSRQDQESMKVLEELLKQAPPRRG